MCKCPRWQDPFTRTHHSGASHAFSCLGLATLPKSSLKICSFLLQLVAIFGDVYVRVMSAFHTHKCHFIFFLLHSGPLVAVSLGFCGVGGCCILNPSFVHHVPHSGYYSAARSISSDAASIQFNSIQFICIAQLHKLQICLGVLYNLYSGPAMATA